ncbi:MAG: WbqC family protein, partial [Prevotellaceae bacterium]|nr:WbqC family protein [Prevotellaceae bacterium]
MTGANCFKKEPVPQNGQVLFFSTCYLPSIDLFEQILSAQKKGIYALDTEELFIKQTFRNRAKILSSQGLQLLTVPVIKKNGQKTKDVKVFNDIKWQRNHLRTLETCYNNSPFFIHYLDEIRLIFDKNFVFLIDLNEMFLSFLISKIDKIVVNYVPTFDFNNISIKEISIIDMLFNT